MARQERPVPKPTAVDPDHACYCGLSSLPYHHVLGDHPAFREWASKRRYRRS